MKYNWVLFEHKQIWFDWIGQTISMSIAGIIAVLVAYFGYVLKKNYDENIEFISFKSKALRDISFVCEYLVRRLYPDGLYFHSGKVRVEDDAQKLIINYLETNYNRNRLEKENSTLMRLSHKNEHFFESYGIALASIEKTILLYREKELGSVVLGSVYVNLLSDCFDIFYNVDFKDKKEVFIERLVVEFVDEFEEQINKIIQFPDPIG